jgi:hypothetical protein
MEPCYSVKRLNFGDLNVNVWDYTQTANGHEVDEFEATMCYFTNRDTHINIQGMIYWTTTTPSEWCRFLFDIQESHDIIFKNRDSQFVVNSNNFDIENPYFMGNHFTSHNMKPNVKAKGIYLDDNYHELLIRTPYTNKNGVFMHGSFYDTVS